MHERSSVWCRVPPQPIGHIIRHRIAGRIEHDEAHRNQMSAGQKKALIVIGHVLSEQSGMKLCAEWLKPLVPDVPIGFIAAPEPFWNPDNPVA